MAQNFKNLNEVMKAANKDAAEQTTTLNILYKSATNVNNAHANRLKYANQLKAAYPEQFKNMKAEDIANGKAKKITMILQNQFYRVQKPKQRSIK
jgi:hypothetical protein